MQRYRINYNWLIGVFAGVFVLAVVATFVQKWQVERNADTYIKRAEQALADDDPLEAFDSFRKYVELRSEDEEACVRMGKVAFEVINLKEATREQRSVAFTILDQTVRTTGDASLRRKLAETLLSFRPQDAEGHLEVLLAEDPANSELNTLLMQAYFRSENSKKLLSSGFNLIGYDQESETFDTEKATLEGAPEVYSLIASVLIQKKRTKKLAKKVIDQMLVANPDSANAHLTKSIFLRNADEKEEAQEFLDKAYELDPKDATILLRRGAVAMSDAENAKKEAAQKSSSEDEKEAFAQQSKAYYQQAKEHFAIGLQEHPDNIVFYRLMATAEQGLEQTDAALQILNQGIAKFSKNQSITLVLYKIDLLLKQSNYTGIEKELTRLTQLNRPNIVPVIDFQRARILYSKKEWAKATKALKRVRPLLLDWPNYQVSAGTMLGFGYEKMGMTGLALQAYTVVLNDYPNQAFAKAGRARLLEHRRPMQKTPADNVDKVIDDMLALPEAEQDWGKVDKLVDNLVEENNLTLSRQKLMRARVLIKRGLFTQAQDLIREAAKDDPDDIGVHYAAVLLVASDPERGPTAALKLLDRLEGKWGKTLRSSTRRADLLAAQNSADVVEQLQSLVASSSELEKAEEIQMHTVVGFKFEQLKKLKEAGKMWQKAAEMEPNSLPIRMHLFDIALRENDDANMQAAQKSILEVVQNKEHPSYLLTEVKRQIAKFRRQEIELPELATGRKLLDTALRQRPEWADLHVLYGQLLLILNEDIDLVMQHLDDALKYGSRNMGAIAIQVKLLADRGLFLKARDRMYRLPENSRARFLGQLEAEILNKTGERQAGFIAAKKFAATQPNNTKVQAWFSRLARQTGELESAVSAIQQATIQNPSNPDQWTQLAGLYTQQKDYEKVESTIREAHLSVDAEYLPLLTAKYYELQSRWQNAESIYRAVYAGRLDELPVAHRMAEFYLLWAPKNELYRGKATPHLNRILRAANSGETTWSNPHVAWARQQAARLLARENDYQQSLKAEQLLQQGVSDDGRSESDLLQLVDILVNRRDPRSLHKAKQLLLDFHEQGRLQKKGMLQLANILSTTNQWDECKSLMLEAISEYRNDPAVWTTYIDLLIKRGEYSGAKTYIKRLRELNPNNMTHIQLSARLAAEQGDTTQLRTLLSSLLPKMGGALTRAQLDNVLGVVQLATRHGDYELAEKLLRTYEKRVPGNTAPLTNFLAMHGDPDEALARMKRQGDGQTDQMLNLAGQMVNARWEEFGEKYNQTVDQLVNDAIRDDPDSISRQLVRAEIFEGQGKNKESIAVYDQILGRDDLPTKVRAAAMNNLGFQLALLEKRLDEAEQLVNEAMNTYGPVSDMLDTRAIVYMAQKKYDQAIEDLELAVSVDQDPVKHYHLAKSYLLAGDGKASQKTWKNAVELGFEKQALPKLEQPGFEAIKRQIEDLQTQSAKL